MSGVWASLPAFLSRRRPIRCEAILTGGGAAQPARTLIMKMNAIFLIVRMTGPVVGTGKIFRRVQCYPLRRLTAMTRVVTASVSNAVVEGSGTAVAMLPLSWYETAGSDP